MQTLCVKRCKGNEYNLIVILSNACWTIDSKLESKFFIIIIIIIIIIIVIIRLKN